MTCEEVGIFRNGIVVRIFVKSYAEFQDQIVCCCPLILKIEAVDSEFEVGFGICRYPSVGTAVEHEVNNSVLQIVERTKHIITLRERQEQIANRIFFLLPPGSQRVIADGVVAFEPYQLRLIIQLVDMTETIAASLDNAAS